MNIKALSKSTEGLRFTKMQIYVLSFLLPFAAMVACMIGFSVQPFGNNSFIIVDGLHQYMPFFTVLYDKLKAGESLFYTFRTGLGINFLSLFSYYLSSPLNLFILLFKKTQLNMAVSLLLALKIALSGLAAAIYFGEKSEEPSILLLLVSVTYALNSYMVGYSWNVMWLDAIMIFPIILLGIERLIEKKDGRLYGIALFYALYCNYYIAFMICIFAVFWFLLYEFQSLKEYICRGISFAIYSLLAAGMAAVILIPAYLGIRQTASGEDMSLPGHEFMNSFTDLISRQFALTNPISHDNFDGNANLYFGVFALLLCLMFFMNTKIRLGKKIRMGLLYLFMMVSCNETILNFIWHGFHNQYGIPNRFSFMMGFVLIYTLYENLTHREGILIWHPILAGGILAGLLWISRIYAGNPEEEATYIACSILMAVYVFLMMLYQMARTEIFAKVFQVAFCLIAIGEMCVTSILGFNAIGQIHVDKFFTGISDMETATKVMDDGTFYRSEMADSKIVDESTMYPMKAISLFGSTAKHDMVCMMDSLGFYTGCNEYLYKGDCPLTNLLLAVRYHYYRELDSKQSDFVYTDHFGEFDVYENPVKNLSVGYLMNKNVEEWFYQSAYPFRVFNSLCQTAWNADSVFEVIDIEDPETNGVTVSRTNDGEYRFNLQEVQPDNITFFVHMAQDQEDLYMHYDGTQVEKIQVEVDNEFLFTGDEDSRVLSLGSVDRDSIVKVSMKLKGENDTGVVRLSMANLNRTRFDALANYITSNRFKVSKQTDHHIEGTITAQKEDMLFFSIPYDEGWTVKVDGKSQETRKIGNAFLSVIIPAGEHNVSLHYISPGFVSGWKISIVSLILFILLNLYHRKKKHSKYAESKEVMDDEDEEAICSTDNDDVVSGDDFI